MFIRKVIKNRLSVTTERIKMAQINIILNENLCAIGQLLWEFAKLLIDSESRFLFIIFR